MAECTLTEEQLLELRAELIAELRYMGVDVRRAPVPEVVGGAHGGRVRRVVDALDRLVAGTYGRCLACRRPIPFARLEAMPETPTCIECSWAHEHLRH